MFNLGSVRLSRSSFVGAVACTALLLAAACGDDDDGNDPDAARNPDGPTPLEAFFGDLLGPTSQQVGDLEGLPPELDQAVAECMRDQGFEYSLMSDQAAGGSEGGGSEGGGSNGGAGEPAGGAEPGGEMAPDEDVDAEFGYGISTTSQGGGADDGGSEGDDEPVRPDAANLEGLTPADVDAYDTALRGDWDGYDKWVAGEISDDELIYGAPEDAGCYGAASADLFPEDPYNPEAVFEEFPDLVAQGEALQAKVEDDPRVVEALADWSDCVADAGYAGFTDPAAAEQHIRDRFDGLTDQQTEELEQLRADEVDLAAADHECQDKVELDKVRRDVQVELEQNFIDDNREELEQLRDALAAAREQAD